LPWRRLLALGLRWPLLRTLRLRRTLWRRRLLMFLLLPLLHSLLLLIVLSFQVLELPLLLLLHLLLALIVGLLLVCTLTLLRLLLLDALALLILLTPHVLQLLLVLLLELRIAIRRRVCRPRGWWPVIAFIGRPIVVRRRIGLRIWRRIGPLCVWSIRRTVRLRVGCGVWPVSV
jgi:hypothetical protein